MTTDPARTPDANQISEIAQNIVRSVHRAAEVSESNTKSLVDALEKHAQALVKSTEASNKAATRLVWATWALVGVTVLLVIVGFLQVLILNSVK